MKKKEKKTLLRLQCAVCVHDAALAGFFVNYGGTAPHFLFLLTNQNNLQKKKKERNEKKYTTLSCSALLFLFFCHS